MFRIVAADPNPNFFDEFSQSFSTFWSSWFLVAGVFFVVVVVGLGVLNFVLRPHLERKNERLRLWRALAQAHALTRLEQDLLRRVATSAGLDSPAEVFVKKSVFDQQIARGRDSAKLTELRAKLF